MIVARPAVMRRWTASQIANGVILVDSTRSCSGRWPSSATMTGQSPAATHTIVSPAGAVSFSCAITAVCGTRSLIVRHASRRVRDVAVQHRDRIRVPGTHAVTRAEHEAESSVDEFRQLVHRRHDVFVHRIAKVADLGS